MYSRIILLLLTAVSFTVKSNGIGKTELVFISAMHGAHKNHPNYDYETLYKMVNSYQPDFVGVELRAEDVNSDTNYLKSNYPYEMVELSLQHKNKVFGFDWLGESIEGAKIPKDYWNTLKVKRLLKTMNEDHAFLRKQPTELKKLSEMQARIIEQATPYSLNNGDYGKIVREKDELEEQWFKGSQYMEIIEFDKERDKKIGDNIIAFVEKHKGSRIVLVMGADHRTFAIENVTKHFGDDVDILPIQYSGK